MQAGAGSIFDWDAISHHMAEGDLFAEEGAEVPKSESVVHVMSQLLHDMHKEVLGTIDRVADTPTTLLRDSEHMRCPLCPFRHF